MAPTACAGRTGPGPPPGRDRRCRGAGRGRVVWELPVGAANSWATASDAVPLDVGLDHVVAQDRPGRVELGPLDRPARRWWSPARPWWRRARPRPGRRPRMAVSKAACCWAIWVSMAVTWASPALIWPWPGWSRWSWSSVVLVDAVAAGPARRRVGEGDAGGRRPGQGRRPPATARPTGTADAALGAAPGASGVGSSSWPPGNGTAPVRRRTMAGCQKNCSSSGSSHQR